MGQVNKGIVSIPGSIAASAGIPIDDRYVVTDKDSLTSLENTYIGIQVFVLTDDTGNPGLYILKDKDSTNPSNWVKIWPANTTTVTIIE